MLQVPLERWAGDDDVIQVSEDMGFELGPQDRVEQPLECGRRGVEPERHHLKLHHFKLQSPTGHGESGYGSAFGRERYLPVPLLQIESG